MSTELELKLAEFRAKKLKTISETNPNKSLNVFNIFGSIRQRINNKDLNQNMDQNKSQTIELLSNTSNSETEEVEEPEFPVDEDIDDERGLFDCDRFQLLMITIKLLIYVLLQTIAILVGFGAVFFSIALLFFICTNLRNRSKRRGELSAYSVFNPNCKPIHGTVSAKDLETQLTFGALHHI